MNNPYRKLDTSDQIKLAATASVCLVYIALAIGIVHQLDAAGQWNESTVSATLAGWLLGVGPLVLVITLASPYFSK